MPDSLRRPTLDDAGAIHALMCACDLEALGKTDATIDDVLDELREPDVDLEQDAWVAVDDEGAALAFGIVLPQADADIVDLDIYVRPSAPELTAPLWDLAESRALAVGRRHGHHELRLDMGIYRSDERKRAVAKARGYTPATVFYRMRIDHTGPVQAPEVPRDVTVAVVSSDERLRRTALDISNASFAEHFGFVERTYEWWLAKAAATEKITWDDIRVLSVDGAPAAIIMSSNQYVADENAGYVDTLGVLKEFRGRGLARLLLLEAFAKDAADGRVATLLHVDVNNVTNARGLYEGVGMRQDMVSDGWRKVVSL